MAIAQRAGQQIALHVVAAVGAIALIVLTRLHLIPLPRILLHREV